MSAPARPLPPANRRGAALLAALAFLVAISVLALELSVDSRARRLAAANALERSAAAAVARAGLVDVRARLIRAMRLTSTSSRAAATVPDPWSDMAGTRLGPSALGGFRYDVVVRDAGLALHLNRAGEEQLRRLMVSLSVDATRADRVAQAVLDWRDGDELRRPRGAERSDYLRLGRAVLPDDAPFRSVEALRHVAGVDAELMALVAPYLTVTGTGRVNLDAAPVPVLAALPGMTEESVALLLRRRRSGERVRDLGELTLALSPPARARLLAAMADLLEQSTLGTDALMVTSTARDADGVARARLDALIVRERGPRVVWTKVSP